MLRDRVGIGKDYFSEEVINIAKTVNITPMVPIVAGSRELSLRSSVAMDGLSHKWCSGCQVPRFYTVTSSLSLLA